MKLLLLASLLSLSACAQPKEGASQTSPAATDADTRRAVVAVLTAQTAAWNRGDLPAFMAGYRVSDSLVFIGKSGLTYGWQPTLDNYRKSYGQNASQMGQLDFGGLRVSPLGPDVAQVVGRWHLSFKPARPGATAGESGELRGQFLLIFRRLGGRWLIVADHSS